MDEQSDATSAGGQQGQQAAPPPEEAGAGSPSSDGGSQGLLSQPRVRLGAIVALAIAAGLIAWLVIGRDNGESTSSSPATTAASQRVGPVGLSPTDLRNMSASLDQPVYWAGERAGFTYEFTHTTNARNFVRYLPPGVKVGASGSDYLIIATYPFKGGYRALKDVAKGSGVELPGGGLAVPDATYPKSVHVAYPGVDYQIEVYDPSPENALRVASSGQVVPVR